jgi:hypothetical protein
MFWRIEKNSGGGIPLWASHGQLQELQGLGMQEPEMKVI